MKDKKIPESYSEKYEKKETESSMDIKSFVDSLFKASDEEEKKTLKVTAQAVKKSQKVSKKIIDIDDDNFELDLQQRLRVRAVFVYAPIMCSQVLRLIM